MNESKTVRQIVADGNELARQFYQSMGYVVPEGYRFDEATHPQEQGCWTMACIAYDHIQGTDLTECLAEWLDEEAAETAGGE